ncbi:sugar phosphate permease [Halopolyspora algeriensis]|uniref:Sugar phosphate permease n=1 Tax=Halopolyspora algeriensis TaxID=1500506 RepID=A0A368VVA1_9ACTN|nr:MFS transporter [Halopolyspora algeriensis]RCW46014.1 sugar phosphate permease [Halopolyspora algeriensis]TQM55427.1 sugar phosphate permease [Halopolyspora algeriensis]
MRATAEEVIPAGPDAAGRALNRAVRSWRGAWVVWGLAALCYFTSLFHRASLGVAAPQALERFSAGPAVLSLFSALQLGVYLALQVPSGLLADRLGPRRVITGGMAALAAGSVVFGLSGSLLGGIAGRMLIGFGDAFMFTNVLRLAAHWFPPRRFGRIAALTGLVGGFGQVVATVPLSAALYGLGWVPTFVGAAAVTAVLAGVAAAIIRDRPSVDAARESGGYEPAEGIGQALRTVWAQRGTRHSFWVHFVLMGQFVAVTALWGPPWLTRAQGYSSADAGMLVLVCVLGFLAGSWLAAQYVAGRPQRREGGTLVVSSVVVLAWGLVIGWPGALPLPLLLGVLIVIGAGGGAAMLAFDGARAANAAHRSGAASGVVNMGGFTAAVLIQLGVGGVLRMVGEVPAVQAYRWGFVPVLVLLAAGTVAQWLRCARRVGPSVSRCDGSGASTEVSPR